MANTSISGLSAGAAVSATDLLPNVQTAGVGPVKTTAAQLKTFMSASPTLVTPNIGVASGTSVNLTSNSIISTLNIGRGLGNDSSSTGVGVDTLKSTTTSIANTALGWKALSGATDGGYNTSLGYFTLAVLTSGNGNCAIGANALQNVTNGNYNMAIGTSSGGALTSGQYNVSIGSAALATATTASFNIGIGGQALGLTTGSSNVGIGWVSGYGITTGSENTVIGSYLGDAGSVINATGSRYIVLADGAYNARAYYDNANTRWTLSSGLQTSAPAGGTAATWKFGSYKAATVVLNTANYIELDIGGVLYKLAVVT